MRSDQNRYGEDHSCNIRGYGFMSRNRAVLKRAAALITAFVMVFTAVLTCAEGAYAADQETKKKTSNKKVHLLQVDNSFDGRRLARCFRNAGVRVTTVYSYRRIKPAKYDGLIIPGGADVNPSLFNQKRHPMTFGVNTKKDRLQIYAIKKFAKAGKPVLGICRGCQVINVAFGGTLIQHINRHTGFRRVRNVKGWWMYDLYGKRHSTYHSHHQVVGRLGKKLVATAYDMGSGHIEAIQHKKLPVYGIQWHPDMNMGKQGRKVFKAFAKICKENRDDLNQKKEAAKAKEKETAAAQDKKEEITGED